MRFLPNSVRRRLGATVIAGMWEYLRQPEGEQSFGGPFNGQLARQKMFLALIQLLTPSMICETGTYKGTTTEFLAQSCKLPILTVEGNKKAYGYSKLRLAKYRHVRVELGDSRQVLTNHLSHGCLKARSVTYYLDAHWNDDLPLAEEVDLIFTMSDDATVVIDDFEVPGDSGYAFDVYGPNKLSVDYLEYVIQKHRLICFFPSCHSAEESGAKRGCVVLAQGEKRITLLRQCQHLRQVL